MPIIQGDAPMYLHAAIGCLRSALELRGLPMSLRQEVERRKVELEKLVGQLREMPERKRFRVNGRE